MKYPDVSKVKTTDDYCLIIEFANGETKTFDVKPYIKGSWYGQLKNLSTFKTVKPCGNTVEWVGGQDIAPHELYECSTSVVQ